MREFFTDDQIAAELLVLHGAMLHQQYEAGRIAREIGRVIRRLDPSLLPQPETEGNCATARNHAPPPLPGQLEIGETGDLARQSGK